MLFKECRKVVSKTDAISILLYSMEEGVYQTYPDINFVPERFNNMEVIGFAAEDTIPVEILEGKNMMMRGIEFYLNDKSNITD